MPPCIFSLLNPLSSQQSTCLRDHTLCSAPGHLEIARELPFLDISSIWSEEPLWPWLLSGSVIMPRSLHPASRVRHSLWRMGNILMHTTCCLCVLLSWLLGFIFFLWLWVTKMGTQSSIWTSGFAHAVEGPTIYSTYSFTESKIPSMYNLPLGISKAGIERSLRTMKDTWSGLHVSPETRSQAL